MITDDDRKLYVELRTKAREAERAAQPQREALEAALKPFRAIEEEIENLIERLGTPLYDECEGCGLPIFEGEPTSSGSDGDTFCIVCSPTYEDITRSPEMFLGKDEEPMTPDEAKAVVDAHLAAGGKLTDTLAV